MNVSPHISRVEILSELPCDLRLLCVRPYISLCRETSSRQSNCSRALDASTDGRLFDGSRLVSATLGPPRQRSTLCCRCRRQRPLASAALVHQCADRCHLVLVIGSGGSCSWCARSKFRTRERCAGVCSDVDQRCDRSRRKVTRVEGRIQRKRAACRAFRSS